MNWDSMFGAGSGSTAFGYDMMVLEDIRAQEEKRNAELKMAEAKETAEKANNLYRTDFLSYFL